MLRGVRPALAPPPPRAARLFGRADTLAEIRRITQENQPLTLVGPAGVGKTELCLHVLATAEGDDHVFVDLTHAHDLDDVLATIAATLDVRAQRDMIAALRAALSARSGLLVLDRCEQAGDAVARVLTSMALEGAVLCTSTRALGYRNERTVMVDPLEREGVALFLARSPMLQDPTHRERALIDELIALSAGLPLAIEWIASIASSDDAPLQLVRELDPRMDHERPLHSVAAWSIDRLDSVTRLGLAQAAVLEGPFESETFEAIVELPADVAPLDVLSTLASVALVGRAPRADARFVIAPLIRGLALELLSDSERLRAMRRHARFMAASAPGDLVARSRERSDLLVAHELALVDDALEAHVAVTLAERITEALLRHGPLERALAIAEATVTRKPSPMLDVLAARARVALGMPSGLVKDLRATTPALALAMGELFMEQGDAGRAASLLADAARDPELAANAHGLLAEANAGNPAEALRCIDRAGSSGPILAERAAILLDLGNAAAARAEAMEALSLLADGRDLRASALAMITLADAQQEDSIVADGTLASARLLARRAGDLTLIARTDALEVAQSLARGELAPARALLPRIEGPLGVMLRTHVDALSACRPSEPPAIPSAARLVRRARSSCVIARDGSRAVLPSGPVLLEKRPILQRLLRAFVEGRVTSPGTPLTVADLFTAGWPGERVPPGVQGDRVHSSLQALRDLGLRAYIVTLTGGWALDPDCAFEVTAS